MIVQAPSSLIAARSRGGLTIMAAASGDSSLTAASTSDRSSERTDRDSKRTNFNTEERSDALSAKERRTDSAGLEHFCEAIQNVPSFDFIWTIEGFSLLPKLGRHFSETFDAKGLKWGLFLKPWCVRGDTRHPSLTLYLEDRPHDLDEKSDNFIVSYRITMFSQGGSKDQQYTDTVVGIFACQLAHKWSSIVLLSYDMFLDPSYGFLVDDTCAFGVEIVDVAPTHRRYLDSVCGSLVKDTSSGDGIVGVDPTLRHPLQSSNTGLFRWTIQGLSTEQQMKPRICKKFSACRYDWIISILVGSSHPLGSECLHIYVCLSSRHIFRQLFGRINIRLINQRTGKHIEKSYCGIIHADVHHGCAGVVPLQTFFNEEEGFLVHDCCIVEVEVTVLSQRPPQKVLNIAARDARGTNQHAAEEEKAYHNPFEWDMSPFFLIFQKDPGFDITDLILKHRPLDGFPQAW